AAAAVAEAAAAVAALRAETATRAEALTTSQERETQLTDVAREAERVLARFKAEAEALEKIVMPAEAGHGDSAPILSSLEVREGFEAATAALFDGELAAPQLPTETDMAGGFAAGWRELPPLPPAALPAGAQPLADRLAALDEANTKIEAELTELDAQVVETERAIGMLPDPALARTGLEASRAQAAAARRQESEGRSTLDRLARDAEARTQRLAGLVAEAQSWQRRRDSAAAQHAVLGERQTSPGAEIAALAQRPAAIGAEGEARSRS